MPRAVEEKLHCIITVIRERERGVAQEEKCSTCRRSTRIQTQEVVRPPSNERERGGEDDPDERKEKRREERSG